MGVVRDVTVDNLVTAVGNIDTSSLAQDSTLQDVVTAIGNISGGSDPVTNTTVNSLCKDTTGQSIASAISGLGTTLGSDKANISGNNIADKATFRTNVGLCPKIKVKQITGTTDNQGRLLSTGWSIANLCIVGIIAGGHGQIALQLRLSNNNFAVKFVDSSGMSVIANTVVSCMVYYIEPD